MKFTQGEDKICGIVGYVSRRYQGLYKKDLDMLEQMFVFNTVRGKDSTGVFCRKSDGDIIGTKTATHPLHLFATDAWTDFSRQAVASGRFVVGHGRHATRGEVKNENAHPFIEQNIILVHNGTLVQTRNITDVSTEVDSHAIAHALTQKTPAEVVRELDGAFALVWFDTETNKLHAVRNDERPLVVMQDEDDGYILCSEDWIGAIAAMRQGRKIKHRVLIEPGDLYTWDASKRNEMSVEQVHLRPAQDWKSWPYNYGARHTGAPKPSSNPTREAVEAEKAENFRSGSSETPPEITSLREALVGRANNKVAEQASADCALTQPVGTTKPRTTTPTTPSTGNHPAPTEEEVAQARTTAIQVFRDDFKQGTVCLFKIHSINPTQTVNGRMKYQGKIREPGKEMVDCMGFLPREVSVLELDKYLREMFCGLVHHVTQTTNGGPSVFMQSNMFPVIMENTHGESVPQTVFWRAKDHQVCDCCGRKVEEWEGKFTSVRLKGDVTAKTTSGNPMNVIEMTCADCVAKKMTGDSKFRQQFEANYAKAKQEAADASSSSADAVPNRKPQRGGSGKSTDNVIALPSSKTLH